MSDLAFEALPAASIWCSASFLALKGDGYRLKDRDLTRTATPAD